MKLTLLFQHTYSKLNDQDTSNDFKALIKQEIVLAVPSNHPLVNTNRVSIQEVLKYPIVCFSANSGLYHLIDHMFATAHVNPNINCDVKEHMVIDFIQYGYGMALIPNLPQLNKNLVHLI